jgi:hypothetical protein
MSMMIKNRKAMQAVEVIVFVVIALVVLVVVLWIFRDQIGKALSGYTSISNETEQTISGEKCKTIIGDKSCEAGPKCSEGTRLVNPPTGKSWIDCKGTTSICCETVI